MRYSIEIQGEVKQVTVNAVGTHRYQIQIEDEAPFLVNADLKAQGVHLLKDGKSWDVALADLKQGLWAGVDGQSIPVQVNSQQAASKQKRASSQLKGKGLQISSSMPGKIIKVVAVGTEVTVGTSLVVIESMKMENELRAEIDGIVEEVCCKPLDLVEGGKILVKLKAKS